MTLSLYAWSRLRQTYSRHIIPITTNQLEVTHVTLHSSRSSDGYTELSHSPTGQAQSSVSQSAGAQLAYQGTYTL